MTTPLILLCAGGTGGHVFPARALAEELLARGYRVAFAVDSRGIKYLDGLDNVIIHQISAGPYHGGLKGKTVFAVSLIKGYIQTHKLISKLKPSVAVGFGGYPSAPPMFAAQHRGVPTVLHEQNAVIGLANKLLAPLAKKIALSFPLQDEATNKMMLTGNPVRAEIIALRDKTYPKIEDTLRLLIFGGSLGAKSFSTIIPHSIIALSKHLRIKLEIAHQAREADIEQVKQIYNNAGLDVEIKTFFDNMPERIEKAHLMICRSGATTVTEATCAGRPAIYIPYPWHKDQQQLFNAETVTEAGGGWILEEKDLTKDRLFETLQLVAPNMLEEAAAFARSLGQPDAVRLLADQVIAQISQK